MASVTPKMFLSFWESSPKRFSTVTIRCVVSEENCFIPYYNVSIVLRSRSFTYECSRNGSTEIIARDRAFRALFQLYPSLLEKYSSRFVEKQNTFQCPVESEEFFRNYEEKMKELEKCPHDDYYEDDGTPAPHYWTKMTEKEKIDLLDLELDNYFAKKTAPQDANRVNREEETQNSKNKRRNQRRRIQQRKVKERKNRVQVV